MVLGEISVARIRIVVTYSNSFEFAKIRESFGEHFDIVASVEEAYVVNILLT
jgi:hypothetical protein